MAGILIIDDDKSLCKTLSRFFQQMGHQVAYALTLKDGLKRVSAGTFDVVFLDVNLPDGSGLEAISTYKKSPSAPEIIIITGKGDPDGAELAIKNDAWAYIEKPPSMEKLQLQLARVLEYRKEKYAQKPLVRLKRHGIVGSSPQLEQCLDLVAQIANSHVNVLITGETGTGKELFSKVIHENSPRADKNFVVVDCAALPDTLVGSMLFGHEKGAFTGADRARVGLLKEADGGTLFLDEVGELPLATQKDFLRALQENRFRPLGSNKEIESNFRLISATHRDLEAMAQSGQFRKDIFFRIQAVTINLPPLRSRPQDIKDLAMHYMLKLCEQHGMEAKGFSPDFFDALTTYNWPGNVRELINTMERVLANAHLEPTLYARHLPTDIRIHQARVSVRKQKIDRSNPEEAESVDGRFPDIQKVRGAAIAKAEKQYLHDLMVFTQRDKKEASRISGLSQSRLYYLLKKYDVRRS